jgi:hypothetical protein
MNSVEIANSLIKRVKELQTFEVKRLLDGPLSFTGGPVPFDIRANQECAWFKVLAISQREAEEIVDKWLRGIDDPAA